MRKRKFKAIEYEDMNGLRIVIQGVQAAITREIINALMQDFRRQCEIVIAADGGSYQTYSRYIWHARKWVSGSIPSFPRGSIPMRMHGSIENCWRSDHDWH
jgi:hypothetical protein